MLETNYGIEKKKDFFFKMGDVILGFGHFDNTQKKKKNLGGQKKNLKKKKKKNSENFLSFFFCTTKKKKNVFFAFKLPETNYGIKNTKKFFFFKMAAVAAILDFGPPSKTIGGCI